MDPKPEVPMVGCPLSVPEKEGGAWSRSFRSILAWVGIWGLMEGGRWIVQAADSSRTSGGLGSGGIAGLLVALGTGWIGALILSQKRQIKALGLQLRELDGRQNRSAEGVSRHLERMEAEWVRLHARDEAMAEPLLNFTGARVESNALHIAFENVGATVMELSVVCETPGCFAEVQPRVALRTGDSGRLVVVHPGGTPEADPTVLLSYVTRLGVKKTKQYAVPTEGGGLVEVAPG